VPASEETVAVSVTAVLGETGPVELDWVVKEVPPTDRKHSFVVAVDSEPVKEVVSGV
jgi:hypothetical protein